MSVTLRCWIAGLAMAFSTMVLTATSDPRGLGPRSIVLLLALFAHGWVLAVGERCFADRGGSQVKRFPLGARLVSGDVDLLPQFLVPAVLLGLATRSVGLGLFACAVVLCLTVSLLRRLLPLVLPVVWVVWSLLNMQEFHTLGDLVDTTRGWVFTALALAAWALVLGGPLLRTDVGGQLSRRAAVCASLAALPGYALAFWLFTRTGLAGFQPDVLALAFALLAGGTVQTILVGLMGTTADLRDREPYDFPDVDARAVGLAMMPLSMPLMAVVAFGWAHLTPTWTAQVGPEGWAGLLVVLLIVPAVPAAGLVGAALDRLDGRSRSRRSAITAGVALALWFVLGPLALQGLYAPGGPLARLADLFPGGGAWGGQAGADPNASASLFGQALGGDLTLYGLVAADLCRAATLMALGVAALTARALRHTRTGLVAHGFGGMTITWGTQALLCALLIPRMGPLGAAMGTVLTCVLMLAADMIVGERVVPVDELEEEQDDGLLLEGDAPLL